MMTFDPLTAAKPGSHSLDESNGTSVVFWRAFRWKPALITGLLLAAGITIFVFALHAPKYQASVLVTIDESAPYLAYPAAENLPSRGHYVAKQLELLRSPIVLSPLISRPEIAAIGELKKQTNPILHLQKHLTISQVGKSDLYQINYVGPSAQAAKTIANAVTAEYLAIQSDINNQPLKHVIYLLKEEYVRRSSALEKLRHRVMELAKEVTGRDPYSLRVLDIDRALSPLASLQERLIDVNIEWEVLNISIQSQKKKNSKPQTDSAISQKRSNKQVPSDQQSIVAMERELTKLDTKKEFLIKQINEEQESIQKRSEKSIELEFAKAELAREEKVFELIAERKLALQTEMHRPTRVRLQQNASVPRQPLDPVPYKSLWIGCLIAFAVPCGLTRFSKEARTNPQQGAI